MAKLYLIIFVAIILVASCAKDIFVEPPADTLRGIYQGSYMYHMPIGQDAKFEKIYCEFTDRNIKKCSVLAAAFPNDPFTQDFQGNYTKPAPNRVIFTYVMYTGGIYPLGDTMELPQSNDTLALKWNADGDMVLTRTIYEGVDIVGYKELILRKIE